MVVNAARLSLEDLSYGYPGRAVGRHIGFTIGAGEVLCVLGRNGEGKSTLFKTILGLLPPRAGAVRVDGEPTADWSPHRRALTFGYVPQSGGGAFPFTVVELVLMGRTAHSGPFAAPSAADREVADGAMATMGIEHLAQREWLRVSGGERQLALIARALAQQPRILALDEPTSSLDFGNQLRVLNAVRSLASERGLTVLLSTHHPQQAFACADRVAVLAGGELLRIGPPAEVVTTETLRACYAVDVAVLPVAQGSYRVCVPRSYLGTGASPTAPGRSIHYSSFPRKRNSEPEHQAVALDPRFRGGDGQRWYYSAARRLGSSVSISARIFGGDIGRSRRRIPVAPWIALATAAIGGTIGTSPTPRTPKGCRRIRHLDDDRVDHRQIRRDRHAIIEEPGVIEAPLLAVNVLLVERPADPLRNAALDLAFDIARMDGSADILRRGVP